MSEGYTVYPNFLKRFELVHVRSIARCHSMASELQVIFNTPTNDNLRLQVPVPESDVLYAIVSKSAERAGLHTEQRILDYVSVLISQPGAGKQMPHSDDDMAEDLAASANSDTLPLSLIVSLYEETYINVWPGSHYLSPHQPENGSTPCFPIRVDLNPGDAIALESGLIHAGAENKAQINNVRLFACFNSVDKQLARNHLLTWIAEDDDIAKNIYVQ